MCHNDLLPCDGKDDMPDNFSWNDVVEHMLVDADEVDLTPEGMLDVWHAGLILRAKKLEDVSRG